MASSAYCFGIVFVAVLLPFLFVCASASTKFIDAICQRVTSDKAFCVQTLSASPTASATSQFQAATAAIRFVESYAEKSKSFAGKAAKENPNLQKQFLATQDRFDSIVKSLNSAALELKESPDTANYDVMVCSDQTTMVKNLVGKNTDKASKTVITMTLMLEKLLVIAVGATVSVGG